MVINKIRNEKKLPAIAKEYILELDEKKQKTTSTVLTLFYDSDSYKTDGKELYEIDYEEIKELFYKNNNGKNNRKDKLSSYATYYRHYFEWLINNTRIKCRYTYDEYDNFLSEILKEFKEENTFLKRSEVYSKSEMLINSNDYKDVELGLVMLSAFEGIVIGKGELNNLKYTDLSGNKLLILNKKKTERNIQIFDEYKKMLSVAKLKATNEYLLDYQAGKREGVNERADRLLGEYRRNKTNNAEKYFTTVLINSGRCFYLSVIEQIIDTELSMEKDKEYYKRINNRYDYSIEDTELKKLENFYNMYKLSDAYEKIDTSKYMNAYFDIMGIEDEADDKKLKVDKELGNAGEKYIENLLIEKYGNDKVIDETQNRQGYDYSVTTDMKMMYEVKSTRQKEQDELIFCMTIKEIKMAFEHTEKYKLCIVYFKDDDYKKLYVVDNPLSTFDFIKNKAERIIDMEDDKSDFKPLEVKMKVPFDKIKEYKVPPIKL